MYDSRICDSPPLPADCVLFTEPGALSPLPNANIGAGGEILLALGCGYFDASLSAGVMRIEALSSSDHGASWVHAGTLLTPQDMAALGFPASGGVDAADLVRASAEANASILLSATPSEPWGYAGCLIFELNVEPPRNGTPVRVSVAADPLEYLAPDAPQFSGACTAAPPLLRWMLPMLFPSQPVPFNIIQSDVLQQ